MPYASLVGYGGGVAIAALVVGHLWVAVLCAVLVLTTALLIRRGFRRGRGPQCR
ncbi:hypothetical protein ABZ897_23540 [Nonomuraea sp. NPDC046802]|uniref:hypothetical protein n=1 Tax=Nonomuraea sp. NPDC046802 TaxID=3154919 RepID=UPI0033E9669E